MTSFRKLAAGALALVMIAATLSSMFFLTGCRKEDEIFIDTNLAPDTRLTSVPVPQDDQKPDDVPRHNYRVHLYWQGTDPDGFVTGYYYAWDDTLASARIYTSLTDSLFKALIDTAGQTRRHTFYVRAVDNEGKLDPTPASVRFDAWTEVPVIDTLYRVEGPYDPDNWPVDPDVKDTILMGMPCEFRWFGYDPDGQGAPVTFSYRLDSDPFSQWTDVQNITKTNIISGTHFFYVKGRDETGAESFPRNYKFVMNFSPDTDIIEPDIDLYPSGTFTVDDRDTIWFRVAARDREEEVLGYKRGGILQVWIQLDTGFQHKFPEETENFQRHPWEHPYKYDGRYYFTSNTADQDHYIESFNLPTGGNKPHEFTTYSKDVEGRFEKTSRNPEDRERYVFWYNHPPTIDAISEPEPYETVTPPFVVRFAGTDVDGEIEQYQYRIDPSPYSWKTTGADSLVFPNAQFPELEPGLNRFTVRAKDNADCWQVGYTTVEFYIAEPESGAE